MTAAESVSHVGDLLGRYRYTYGNELALHDGLQSVLESAGLRCDREHRLEHGRVDLYLPDLRIAIEVKVAGTPGDVTRQIARYADSTDVDGVVLVTTRIRHENPGELGGKPVAVVYLGLTW